MGRKHTFEELRLEALKYNTKIDFLKLNSPAYQSAYRRGILDSICTHMVKWNYKNIKRVALKYKTKSSFREKDNAAYMASYRSGKHEKICSHMSKVGNSHLRGIYAFEFSDNSVYVGLTYNYSKRYSYHMRKNKTLIGKSKTLGHVFVKFNEWFDISIAGQKEILKIKDYTNRGWNILNKREGGGLGGNSVIWTEGAILKEALKYKTKIEFQRGCKSAYIASINSGKHDYYCRHMIPRGTWTHEAIMGIALSCTSRKDFKSKNQAAYKASVKSGIHEYFCSHMK